MIGPVIRIGWCLVCKQMSRLCEITHAWRTTRRAHSGTCVSCQTQLDEEAEHGD